MKRRYKRLSVGNLRFPLEMAKSKGYDIYNLDLRGNSDYYARCAPFFNKEGYYYDRLLNICWIELGNGIAYIIDYHSRFYENILRQEEKLLTADEEYQLHCIVNKKNIPGYLKNAVIRFNQDELWRQYHKRSFDAALRFHKFMKERKFKRSKKPCLPLP